MLKVNAVIITLIVFSLFVSVSINQYVAAQILPQDSTSTNLSVNPTSVNTGKQTTVTASVSDTTISINTPSGTVIFGDNSAGGTFGTESCSASNSILICTVTYTAPGIASSVTITGTYSGDLTHAISSGSTSLLVNTTVSEIPTGITVYAHRIPAAYWDPCFASECNAGTGPGTTMHFALYDSSGNFLRDGFADEHGYTFSNLNPNAIYYVYPTDCGYCHFSFHDVVFEYWGDNNNNVRPRAATAGADLHAWYSCTNGCA